MNFGLFDGKMKLKTYHGMEADWIESDRMHYMNHFNHDNVKEQCRKRSRIRAV